MAVLALGYSVGPATKKPKKPKGHSLIQKIFAKRGLVKCSFKPLKYQLDSYQIAADRIYGRQIVEPS